MVKLGPISIYHEANSERLITIDEISLQKDVRRRKHYIRCELSNIDDERHFFLHCQINKNIRAVRFMLILQFGIILH